MIPDYKVTNLLNSIKRSLSGGRVCIRKFCLSIVILSEPGIYNIIIDGTKGISYAKIEPLFIFITILFCLMTTKYGNY
ncbi:MAG: hypothetical protein AMS23_06975 [Bacteroides sp. SM1_62]|nr:MAG: hypothetical protein AMS26_11215 [Bacteroides sp. SM23_62]KPL23182.1 MAG: hypothetical protein AMS23_06975 [Bacteroides sp. SM1_62]